MKILYVTSRSPFPPSRGDALAMGAYHQLRILARRHEITLVAPSQPPRTLAASIPAGFRCETVNLPWSRATGLLQLWKVPFSALPIQVLYVYPPSTQTIVSRLLATGRFDLAHVQLVRMGPVLDAVTVPSVLDYRDAFSMRFERRARLTGGLQSWVLRFEAARMRWYERELAQQVTFCTVTSAADREDLGNPPNCVVIPNGVDLEQFPYRPVRRPSPDIVFTGAMRYYPNADAAAWFATAILPRVRAVVPDARFIIAGANPVRSVRRLRRLPGVVVTGYVPSIAEYLGRAAVAVAPLRCATGIQNKVLEAMAAGTPVVSTPDAVRGIEATAGQHLLVGRSEEELAGHVCRLLQDRYLAAALADQARQLVESLYTWERSVSALEHVYGMAGTARAPADRLPQPAPA